MKNTKSSVRIKRKNKDTEITVEHLLQIVQEQREQIEHLVDAHDYTSGVLRKLVDAMVGKNSRAGESTSRRIEDNPYLSNYKNWSMYNEKN